MPHYNSFDSFKTKKSVEKKQRAKEKYISRSNSLDFIVDECDNYGIVIETNYNNAFVFFCNQVVSASLSFNGICNQVVFPGDKVVLSYDNGIYKITNLIKRSSILSRVKKDSTRKDDIGTDKIIATNIDLAVIVVAVKNPPLHPKFIDRYLMILKNSNIPTIICLNKCDLKTDEDKMLSIYKKLGIPVIETSTNNDVGIDNLKSFLLNKQAIFVGNSGVGKSSLTNALMNDQVVKTSHVSDKSKRGRHTTTSSKYYVWCENSSIIDTPGIRSLDVSTFSPLEIQDYFLEFDKWRGKCKYHDCLHYHESIEDCIIKQAVSSKLINCDRYESYLRIISDVLEVNDYEEILNKVLYK